MQKSRTRTLIEQYGKYAPLSLNEAGALAARIFAKTPASHEEAADLLGACALFDRHDRGWQHIVVTQVRRALCKKNKPRKLRAGAEDWLIATLATTPGLVDETVLELVRDIATSADNASLRLGRLGLRAALSSLRAAEPKKAQGQPARARRPGAS